MEQQFEEWKNSSRDNEMHRLNWGKNNPELILNAREKLKERIIKLNQEMGNTMNLKEEYPTLFDD